MSNRAPLAVYGGPKAVPHDPFRRLRLRHGIQRSLDLLRAWPLTLRGYSTIADDSAIVGRLEAEMRALTGRRHALAMNNGTATLYSAYFALGVRPGSEVIVPAYTWHASVTPVLACGAVPVFCEIDPRTLALDPDDVERRITERTRAICVLHPWGNPALMDRICALAGRHGLAVIEDCSHAHGATYRNRPVGSWGDVGCFSLQGAKAVDGGEAGIAVTDDPTLFDRMLLLGHNGRLPTGQRAATFDLGNVSLGLKFRPHMLACVWAQASLRRLPARNRAAARIWRILCEELEGVAGIRPIEATPDSVRGGYYSFVFEYQGAERSGPSIEEFVAAVRAEGAPLDLDHFRGSLLHQQPLFRDLDRRELGGCFYDPTRPWPENLSRVSLPVTEAITDRLVRFAHDFYAVPDGYARACGRAIRKVLDAVLSQSSEPAHKVVAAVAR